jgi:hypothetical protein
VVRDPARVVNVKVRSPPFAPVAAVAVLGAIRTLTAMTEQRLFMPR